MARNYWDDENSTMGELPTLIYIKMLSENPKYYNMKQEIKQYKLAVYMSELGPEDSVDDQQLVELANKIISTLASDLT